MKVLVFTTVFPNPAQPIHGLFVYERIRHLAALAEVRVVAPVSCMVRLRSGVPRASGQNGLAALHPTFWYLPGLFKVLDGILLFLSSLMTVVRLRREFDFDLIDAHFAFPDGFAAILLGRWFRRPVTITLRGTMIPLSVYRTRRAAISWAVSRAAALIAVAQPLADHARSLGADPRRVETIPNGVDVERFFPTDRAEARRALGLAVEGRLLVSVGHLSPRKGFQRVMDVLPQLLAEFPDLRFAIIGGAGAERSNEAELRGMAGRPELQEHVIFVGPQPPATVRMWLSAADVFVLASDYEGCPNAVWEAMACGRPVVASKVGEVERMVPPHAGLLFDDPDDRDALRRCLAESFRTTWQEERITAHAAAHTWAQVALRVRSTWQRVLDAARDHNGQVERGTRLHHDSMTPTIQPSDHETKAR